MREVHSNPQTTSAVQCAIFYFCQQKLCPVLKAPTAYYISRLAYRKQGKANRVIQVGSSVFPSPPFKTQSGIKEKPTKQLNQNNSWLSCRTLTEQMTSTISTQIHSQIYM